MTTLMDSIRKAMMPTKAERIQRYKEEAELMNWKLKKMRLDAEAKEITQKSQWNPDKKRLGFLGMGGKE